jgi:hypothetical protein
MVTLREFRILTQSPRLDVIFNPEMIMPVRPAPLMKMGPEGVREPEV